MFYLNKFNQICSSLRAHGIKFTLESALMKRGLNVYSTVKYPITGIKVKVRHPNIFCWKDIEMGRYELNCFKFLSNIIKEEQTILDVGAHFGEYALLFSKLMKDTGQVYSFEPDPISYYILRDNVNMNSLFNVHIEKLCLSNHFGKSKLRTKSRFGDPISSIVRFKQEIGLKEILVETTTIDKYCEEKDIIPDGIKIDVEGAEGLVIEGCRNMIKKFSPWILLEFHSTFMSGKERQKNWDNIIKSAKKRIFL